MGSSGQPRITQFVGHGWTPPPGVNPALTEATFCRGTPTPLEHTAVTPNWLISVKYEGATQVWIGSRNEPPVRHRAGQALVIRPGITYWTESERRIQGAESAGWVRIEDPNDSAGLAQLLSNRNTYGLLDDSMGRIGRIVHALSSIGQTRGESAFWQAQGLLGHLIALLHRYERADDTSVLVLQRERGNPFASQVDRHLKKALIQGITLEELASAVHVSTSTLVRRYRDATGRSPIDSLIEIRIGVARQLLLQGWQLKQIAAHTGFSDPSHLSNTFKRRMGMSPRAYLHSVHKAASDPTENLDVSE